MYAWIKHMHSLGHAIVTKDTSTQTPSESRVIIARKWPVIPVIPLVPCSNPVLQSSKPNSDSQFNIQTEHASTNIPLKQTHCIFTLDNLKENSVCYIEIVGGVKLIDM